MKSGGLARNGACAGPFRWQMWITRKANVIKFNGTNLDLLTFLTSRSTILRK